MLLGHVALLALYARNYPFSDELHHASATITPAWLWAQHAEHRIPIAKLLWLGVLKLTNYDFRVGNWLSVAGVGASSFALIQVATKLRGRITFTDAFFPLAVLSFGQTLNFLWWWQINHILAPLIATSLLGLMAVFGKDLTLRRALVVAFSIILLALSGPGGLPYALALGLWLSYRSILFVKCSSRPDTRKGLFLLTLVAIAFVVVGLYFRDYANPPGTAAGQEGVSPPDVKAWLKGILLLVSISLGPAIKPYWHIAGPALVGLLLLSVGALVVAWRRQPQERLRILGLLLFNCAVGSLFVVLARARVGLGEDYLLIGHYLTLAVPALCAAYLGSLLYAGEGIRRLVHASLFLGTAALLWPNTQIGWGRGVSLHRGQEAFEHDLRAGVPPFILSERYLTFLSPASPDPGEIRALLERMRLARIPQFVHMTPDPLYQAVSVPVAPLMSREPLDEETRRHRNSSEVARFDFDLGEPRFVLAIRIRCVYGVDARRLASFQLIWRQSRGPDVSSQTIHGARTETVAVDVNPDDMWARRYGRVGKKTVTIWINDEVTRFSVVPDREPVEFRISEVDLLVPAAVPPASKP